MVGNVYDFDETIYDGDSTADFFKYCLKKNKKIILCLPYQGIGFILYIAKIYNKTKFKEHFYVFLKKLDNIDDMINSFWEINKDNIKSWYFDIKEDNDMIISASPEFLLEPICKELNIKYLIASNVDKNTGKYDGLNCKGEEKVKRLRKEYPKYKINKFYSDSKSDTPLANISKEAFLVNKNNLSEWK